MEVIDVAYGTTLALVVLRGGNVIMLTALLVVCALAIMAVVCWAMWGYPMD